MWIIRENDGTLVLTTKYPVMDLYGNYDYGNYFDNIILPSGWFPEIHEMECYKVDFEKTEDGPHIVFVARDSNGECYIHIHSPTRVKYSSAECYVSGVNLEVDKKDFMEILPMSGIHTYNIYIPTNKKRKMKKVFKDGTI